MSKSINSLLSKIKISSKKKWFKITAISVLAVMILTIGLIILLSTDIDELNATAMEADVTYSPSELYSYNTENQQALALEYENSGFNMTGTEGYTVEYKKVTAKTSYEDIANFGLNDDIFWPGAMVKIGVAGTSKQDNIAPINLKRAPMTLSMNVEGATGITYAPQTVQNPSLSSVRSAISAMVQQTHIDGAQLPYKIATQLTEVRSESELALALNVGVSALPINIKNNLTLNMTAKMTNAVLLLQQIYYTIDMDAPGLPSDLFDPSVKAKMFESAFTSGSEIPAYVASVTYGRMAVIQISSTMSFSKLQNVLNVDYKGLIASSNDSLDLMLNSKDETTSINCFIYGGSISGNQSALNQTSIQEILTALNSEYDPLKNIGVPISYKFRYLDGTMAKVSAVNEYVIQELKPIEVSDIIIESDDTLDFLYEDSLSITVKTYDDYKNFDINIAVTDAAGRAVSYVYKHGSTNQSAYINIASVAYVNRAGVYVFEFKPNTDNISKGFALIEISIGAKTAQKIFTITKGEVNFDIITSDRNINLYPGESVQFYAQIYTAGHESDTVTYMLENQSDSQYVSITSDGKLTVKDLKNIAYGEYKGKEIYIIAKTGLPGNFSESNRQSVKLTDYILIYTAEQLKDINKDLTASYALMSDINLYEFTNWEPLGYSAGAYLQFTGVFDGNNKEVKNLTSVYTLKGKSNVAYGGLFSIIGIGGIVKNLKLTNVNLNMKQSGADIICVGALAGTLNGGRVENCFVSGNVTYNQGNIGGKSHIGGLLGETAGNNNVIINCENTASVFSARGSAKAGGIVGVGINVKISGCTNSGTIYSIGMVAFGNASSGGIVGESKGGVIASSSDNSNTGVVTPGGGWDIDRKSGQIIGRE
ncbi:MAG: thiol-activated cytolysin family protein [Clostridiales bacterium]|jgi:hypothetical protein|nr:thiol-activated cytolysin family protein [Clostridiales bacterium]